MYRKWNVVCLPDHLDETRRQLANLEFTVGAVIGGPEESSNVCIFGTAPWGEEEVGRAEAIEGVCRVWPIG